MRTLLNSYVCLGETLANSLRPTVVALFASAAGALEDIEADPGEIEPSADEDALFEQ